MTTSPDQSTQRLMEVVLRVTDIHASAAFYRDVLGIPLGESHAHPPEDVEHYETGWGSWPNDDGNFMFFGVYPETSEHPRTVGAYVGFSTDDLDALHERAESAGADVVQAPLERPWGRTAQYRDPDGHLVSVMEARR